MRHLKYLNKYNQKLKGFMEMLAQLMLKLLKSIYFFCQKIEIF